ncbi:MAG: RpoL/Rpb11 RNA polymerase subunit family protein [Promethearchaeota archaeon]
MKLEILNQTKNELELKILEEGHTLMSLLRKELFNDPSVIHSGYMVKHPLIKEVRFFIKTSEDKNPLEALRDALKKLDVKIDEFQTKFEDITSES